MPARLEIIAAGAVYAYLDELFNLRALRDFAIHVDFAPAGVVRAKVQSGAAYDLILSSADSLAALSAKGLVAPESLTPLGITEVAACTRDGCPTPKIENEAALLPLLHRATSIHLPNVKASTAGAHMQRVIDGLVPDGALSEKIHSHPNGAATMQAIAKSKDAYPLGFTQRSEIIPAPGTLLGDNLPGAYALQTVYAVAVCVKSNAKEAAHRFLRFLMSAKQAELREAFGFDRN